jgi:hypothetical protein
MGRFNPLAHLPVRPLQRGTVGPLERLSAVKSERFSVLEMGALGGSVGAGSWQLSKKILGMGRGPGIGPKR